MAYNDVWNDYAREREAICMSEKGTRQQKKVVQELELVATKS
jgi:hypothetical protein